MSFINGLLTSAFCNITFMLDGFDLGTFFTNLTDKAKTWGHLFIVFLGVILVVWGIVNIVKAFISQGRGQTNWLMTIAMILVGGFLIGLGNWDAIQNFLQIGSGTITALGESSGP